MYRDLEPKHIGNYEEDWRQILQQAIDETGFSITIHPGTYGYAIGLYSTDRRDHKPFHDRVQEFAKKAGLKCQKSQKYTQAINCQATTD